jgi:DNA polymerase-3 subunit delta'
VISLRPLPARLIEKTLEQLGYASGEKAQLLAGLAGGRLGWAISASTSSKLLEERQEHLEQLSAALAGNRVARFALAEKLAGKPDLLFPALRNWLSWWRDAALIASGNGDPANAADPQRVGEALAISNIDRRAEIEARVHAWGRRATLRGFFRTEQAIWQLERNGNTRLVIENLLLAFPLT